MKQVIEFLLGESDLDGFHFGESPKRKPFFWRKHLREEWHRQQGLIEQLQARVVELEQQNLRLAKVFNDATEADYVFTEKELAERDSETARSAILTACRSMASSRFDEEDFLEFANQYAERVKRGEHQP